MNVHDPRDSVGAFGALLGEISQCKRNRTCSKLNVRQHYFEPNSKTIGEWHRENRFTGEIDRRVMFVCESPSSSGGGKDSPTVLRNWAPVGPARRFACILKEYGLDHCYITDAVKCGEREGSFHTDQEIDYCVTFLAREIELIQPLVVVGVGGNAARILRENLEPALNKQNALIPVFFHITHYSAWKHSLQSWEKQFPELMRLLGRLCPRSEWGQAPEASRML